MLLRANLFINGITLRHILSALTQSGPKPNPASCAVAEHSSFCKFFKKLLAGSALVLFFQTTALAQNVSCTCRYQGEDYGIGESICLKSPNGLKMATCSMVLNNTSWKISNAPCPFSKLDAEDLEPVDMMPARPTPGEIGPTSNGANLG